VVDIKVSYRVEDQLVVRVGSHRLLVDQPRSSGGDDLGPTPTGLFVAGLAACVGFYAERYLRRHGLDPAGLVVDCDYDFSEDRPSRVSGVRIAVTAPGLLEAKRKAFLRVVEHCTVHNSLVEPPTVTIDLARSAQAA
jgi:uncharacterized OsmC-like protein